MISLRSPLTQSGWMLALLTVDPSDLDWPEYRGPTRNGVVGPVELPLSWSEEKNLRWKTAVHGRGWSTPVAGAGLLWLTTADEEGHHLSVLALDLESGEVLIDREVFAVAEPQERNALNSYASPSAVLGPERVYLHFGAHGTAALDAATGETLWERTDLDCEHLEGPGSSPVLLDGRLVFHMDGAEEQYVVALDPETGETLWQVPRDFDYEPLIPDFRKAYSTPLPLGQGPEAPLFCSAAQVCMAYDASDGSEVWRVHHPGFSMSSRPISDGERVYVNTGFMQPSLLAIRLGGEGDVSESHVDWTYKKNVPTMSSPVLGDGRLYFVNDGGIATCLDVAKGEHVWRERLGGQFIASPILAADRLYFFDREGKGTIVAASDTFEVLAVNELDEGCMASPIVVAEALIVRTSGHVYCIEEPSPEGE